MIGTERERELGKEHRNTTKRNYIFDGAV